MGAVGCRACQPPPCGPILSTRSPAVCRSSLPSPLLSLLTPVLLVALKEKALPEPALGRIRQAAGGTYRVVRATGEDAIREHLERVEIAFGWFPPALLPEAKALRWVQSWAAGTGWIFGHEEIESRPELVVTTASGVHPKPIAEHTVGMLVMLARRFRPMMDAQRKRHWSGRQYDAWSMMELAGSTVTVVGTGAIGQRVAEVADAMGMRVLGVRRDPSKDVSEVDEMFGTQELHEALHEADAVVSTLPKTPETEGLFDEEAFDAMKAGALFVNVGRGEVADEEALAEALRTGALGGAGLDVFEEEPLPEDSPLWEMENVVITPHVAGLTPHYAERTVALFIDNLARWQQREALRNVADRERGY